MNPVAVLNALTSVQTASERKSTGAAEQRPRRLRPQRPGTRPCPRPRTPGCLCAALAAHVLFTAASPKRGGHGGPSRTHCPPAQAAALSGPGARSPPAGPRRGARRARLFRSRHHRPVQPVPAAPAPPPLSQAVHPRDGAAPSRPPPPPPLPPPCAIPAAALRPPHAAGPGLPTPGPAQTAPTRSH